MESAHPAVYQAERDVERFPEFAGLATTLRSRATQWWTDWVPADLAIPLPALRMQVRDISDAAYSSNEHAIYLFLMETDIEAVDNEAARESLGMTRPGSAPGMRWAPVTGQLLHELLHAYQAKVMLEPTPDGVELFKTAPTRWSGSGHDEWFYSAIAAIAPYFHLTPEEFACEL